MQLMKGAVSNHHYPDIETVPFFQPTELFQYPFAAGGLK
jgi:hypothetical protein